ncbi:MAG: hydrogenase accessory protein HypB [Chloroflexi bacterium HGW-Chloroflexi-1]|nr:MAG: hydrogenase accessory protein HypB [Chloroflexi bacterium HGW-Chloroflexi-1]
MTRIPVITNILAYNDAVARDVRQAIGPRVLTLNLISSPGAGKTSLIERTAAALAGELRLAVIEGDLATTLDAARVAAHGVPVVQINTDGGCHLEARQIMAALPELPLAELDVLIIENVGNLVCPTEFDLGEDAKVALISLPEGDDKPLKYPGIFLAARAVVLNKMDLAPYLPMDVERLRQGIMTINSDASIIPVSCITGEGLAAWLEWVRRELRAKRARISYTKHAESPTP